MRAETTLDEFHDNEAGDIFDLYNACNGVFRGNLLDERMLDDYSAEEAAEINVARLKEVWTHHATGCHHCQTVIDALNQLRGAGAGVI